MSINGFDLSPIRQALARCVTEGVTIRYWWRDDDATHVTPALERLLTLSRDMDVAVALAVIPARAEKGLNDRLVAEPETDILVHGLSHQNHSAEGTKKAEFGANRPVDAMLADAGAGLERLRVMMGRTCLQVFVPPWNRIADQLVPSLASVGYRGLSTFGPIALAPAAPGLRQVNTHIDPIAWKAGGGLVDPPVIVEQISQAILQRMNAPEGQAEPLGLLTHHMVHDEEIWRFSARLLETFRASPAMKPARAVNLFADASG